MASSALLRLDTCFPSTLLGGDDVVDRRGGTEWRFSLAGDEKVILKKRLVKPAVYWLQYKRICWPAQCYTSSTCIAISNRSFVLRGFAVIFRRYSPGI